MVDTCRVEYVSGSTFDEDEGRDVPTYTARFESVCKVQARALVSPADAEAGGRESTTVRLSVHLPVSAGAVEVDDVVEILTATYDAQLVGRRFRVTAPAGKSFATARRVEVDEVVA